MIRYEELKCTSNYELKEVFVCVMKHWNETPVPAHAPNFLHLLQEGGQIGGLCNVSMGSLGNVVGEVAIERERINIASLHLQRRISVNAGSWYRQDHIVIVFSDQRERVVIQHHPTRPPPVVINK